MPKVKKRRSGKIAAEKNNPLFDPRGKTKKKGKNTNVLPRTTQDTQPSESKSQNPYDRITCNPGNINRLNTKEDIESAARLFAEFKQTYLNGDVGFIWIKEENGEYKKYRITTGQLIRRVVNPSKGIIKGIMHVYNISFKKGQDTITQNNVSTLPLAGFLDDSSNYIIQVNNRRVRKKDLLSRFNKFKTDILTASGDNQAVINKLIYNICGLLAPVPDQNNESPLEIFNYRVRHIDGVVFEGNRSNRGGLITFIQRLVQMQGAAMGGQVNYEPKSIFKGPNNSSFILNETLSQNVSSCNALQLSEDPSTNFQNSLQCGLWLQISLPSVPHLVTVIVKNGQIFTFGGGYNEPMVAIPSLTFEFGTMWVYSPDDLIFSGQDAENTQVLVKWGFYNETIQNKLNKMLAELNQNYSKDRKSFVSNPGRPAKYYRINGYYSSLSNRIFNMFGISNCSVLGHSVVGGQSNVCMLFDAPWDMKKFGFPPESLDKLLNFVTSDSAAAPAMTPATAAAAFTDQTSRGGRRKSNRNKKRKKRKKTKKKKYNKKRKSRKTRKRR
jgi:hypothetical protein